MASKYVWRLRIVAGGTLFLWVGIVRGVPVFFLDKQSDINIWMFWALDVLPIPLYIWSIEKMYRSWRNDELRSPKFWWYALVFVATFVAPYAYLIFIGASDLHAGVVASIVIVMVVMFALGPVRTLRKKRSSREE